MLELLSAYKNAFYFNELMYMGALVVFLIRTLGLHSIPFVNVLEYNAVVNLGTRLSPLPPVFSTTRKPKGESLASRFFKSDPSFINVPVMCSFYSPTVKTSPLEFTTACH